MKKFVVAAAVAALGFVGVASAADMPTKVPVMAPTPVFSWTGFYLGVQGGAARSNSAIDEQASFSNSLTANTPIKDTSGDVGIYGGYNYQFSRVFLLGGEADFNWTHLSGVAPPFALVSGPGGACGSAGVSTQICVGPVTSNVRWYGTVRGTVGLVADDRLLLYATGGLAYGEVAHSVAGTLRVATVNLPPFSVDDSAVRYGWTVGLGTAAKVTDRISLRVQWNYVDLGRHTVFATSGSVQPGPPPASPFSVSVTENRIAFNTIRAGLAYHFP
jgi:outer membrane immunogenic protein